MSETAESGEFLEKFGYRGYDGTRKGKLARIMDLIIFEVKTTWNKSTFGKVLLIIILVLNGVVILIVSLIGGALPDFTHSQIRNSIDFTVATYLNFVGNPLRSSLEDSFFAISIQIGFLLIALFGIAGSGLFADDKEGRVIEIYLSRISKSEYIIGKIGAILVYTNIFLMGPLLIITFLNLQSFGVNQIDFISLYLGVIAFSLVASLILGLLILLLSSLVEKRNYASLSYFLIYVLGGIFGFSLYALDQNNQFLLLLSPEIFLSLLAFVCLGDFNIARIVNTSQGSELQPLLLNDGIGIEYWHVLLTALGYIVVFSILLYYKIAKLTTEEL